MLAVVNNEGQMCSMSAPCCGRRVWSRWRSASMLSCSLDCTPPPASCLDGFIQIYHDICQMNAYIKAYVVRRCTSLPFVAISRRRFLERDPKIRARHSGCFRIQRRLDSRELKIQRCTGWRCETMPNHASPTLATCGRKHYGTAIPWLGDQRPIHLLKHPKISSRPAQKIDQTAEQGRPNQATLQIAAKMDLQ